MKFATTLAMASLAATGLAAHRGRHARFHDAKREADIIELTKRAIEADPTLEKRCGETVNAGQWGSFPNCWGSCASAPECGNKGGAAPSPAAPAASPAAQSPAAESPAAASTPAATSAAPVNVNVAQPAAHNQDNKPASSHAAPAATSAASTPQPSSSASSGTSSDSTGKIGLAYNDPSLISGDWLNGHAAWAYNWGFEAGKLNSKLSYVPMFHDATQATAFSNALGSMSSDYLLSLNEPDMPGGSEGGSALSVADACKYHKQVFTGTGGKKVSSPAVSSTDAPGKGLDYLKQFHSTCGDAQVNFVALHWYGAPGTSGADQGATFLKFVDTAKSTVNSLYGENTKIWFTEIGASPRTDANVNADFLNAIMKTLMADDRIERVAPFMVGAQGALGTNEPSAAGKVLIAA